MRWCKHQQTLHKGVMWGESQKDTGVKSQYQDRYKYMQLYKPLNLSTQNKKKGVIVHVRWSDTYKTETKPRRENETNVEADL